MINLIIVSRSLHIIHWSLQITHHSVFRFRLFSLLLLLLLCAGYSSALLLLLLLHDPLIRPTNHRG